MERPPLPTASPSPARRPVVARTAEWLAYRIVLPRRRLLLGLSWALLPLHRLPGLSRRTAGLRYTPESLLERLRPDPDPDVLLFTGCVMNAWQRDTHRAALRIMRAAGARPGLSGPEGACCGGPHLRAGMEFDARRLARAVIRSLPGDAPVVACSARCGAMLKSYGEVLETADAHSFAGRVRNFSEWLDEHGAPPLRDTGRTVVIPPGPDHGGLDSEAVRKVLAPAYRLVDLDDEEPRLGADGPSGGAAAVPTATGEAANAAIHRAGGADAVVASADPDSATRLLAAGVEVRHPATLLEAALGASPRPTGETADPPRGRGGQGR